MRIESDTIVIRDFSEGDLPLMLKWLTDDRVLEFYEGRDVRFTPETLAAHYLEEIPCGFRVIMEFEGAPVGYAQVYQLVGELFEEYDYPDYGRVVFAVDQFIGEPDYWNQGIGSRFLLLMAEYLKSTKGAEAMVLDPRTANPRAVRCYEKAGFRKVKLLPEHELHEGIWADCWLMEKLLQRFGC